MKNILFCVCSLGLGHATRTLPIIKHYLSDNNIFIVSTGQAMIYLKEELKGYENVKFYEYKDYPALERGHGIRFYIYLLKDIAHAQKRILSEHKFVERFVEENKIDFIIADGKFGCYSTKVPSFLINHQVKLGIPSTFSIFQKVVDRFNYECFRNFDVLLIPDFKDKNVNLAGGLSHSWILKKLDHQFIGLLSSYTKKTVKQDIDYYFIVSGYLHETKQDFVSSLIEESKKLPGKKVFSLGDTKNCYHKIDKENNIEIYSCVSGELRNDLMNRAKVVVSRSGYTTVMDVVELGKKAVFAPTPNQTEQEYLADYLDKKRYFPKFNPKNIKGLDKLLIKAKNARDFENQQKTADTINKIDLIVKQTIKRKKAIMLVRFLDLIKRNILIGLDNDKNNISVEPREQKLIEQRVYH
ncbi:MAG: glycosyltransferase [Candidatus Pacearchaeota archaeon]|jgi:uncharacterized protein (TIGR00661 family)